MYLKRGRSRVFLLSALFLCIGMYSSFAQHARMDSLKQELLTQSNDTSKADILVQLSFNHHQIDVALCRAYAEEALQISERINDTIRIVQSYNCLGIASDLEGNSNQAIKYWEKCLHLSKEKKYLLGERKAYNNLGLAHKEKGNIEKSLQYFLAAINIDEVIGNISQTVNTLSNVGYLYMSMDDMEHAYKYLTLGIEKGENEGIRADLTNPYQRMGEYYVKKREYLEALRYLQKAYGICQEYAQELRKTTVLTLIGECQYYLGLENDAMASFVEAENKLNTIGEKYTSLFTLYEKWSLIYAELGEHDLAFEKATIGYELAKAKNLESSKLASLELLGQLHEEIGNYKEALHYQRAASEQQEKLDFRSKEELLLELETKYQSDKKEVENELLRSQQEKSIAQLRNNSLLMLAFALVSILVGVIAFVLYNANRIKQRYNDQLVEQVEVRTQELENSNSKLKKSNAELERYAYIASHDLKTPLRNIISFTSLIERKVEHQNDKQLKDYLSFIKKSGRRMNILIQDLLTHSKISSSNQAVINERIDLNDLCKELINSIQQTLKERNAEIQVKNPLPVLFSNYSSFFLLFKNLIENGIKYNESEKPLVTITFEENRDTFIIYITDNGIGIEEKYFNNIWDMFSRLHNSSKYEGTGLGLATCKKIAETFNITIHVSSKLGEGTTFKLEFPSYLRSKESVEKHLSTSKSSTTNPEFSKE